MNTHYVIHITTKHGRSWRYLKEKNGWIQTAPTGIVRQLSGDRLLSHLLPPLAGDQPGLIVRVERKRATKKKTPNASTSRSANAQWKESAQQSFAPPEEEGCVAK